MSKIEVNTVAPQCGTTLTLGESGDTVTLGTGASQSGFGRTGTVDWDTTPKTATFTAVNGDGFFANTSGSAFNMNLPAGSAGAIVSVADYAATWDVNNLTVVPNGSDKIGGVNTNLALDTKGQSVTFLFVDSTQGWINIQDSTSNERAAAFMTATGGTITTSGNCKIHTFTGPGTFTVCSVGTPTTNNVVSYLVVAGGASGGAGNGGAGAGGGAGGLREYKSPVTPYTASPLNGNPGGTEITATAASFPITVGAGGAAAINTPPDGNTGNAGNPSTFSTVTSTGGGGGFGGPGNTGAGAAGGSGGGSVGIQGYPSPTAKFAGGAGNTPPVSPSQGNSGGEGNDGAVAFTAGGGGGGAGAAGTPYTPSAFPTPASCAGGMTGGAGATTSINATPTAYAGGGGGTTNNCGTEGAGGAGGGGAGLSNSPGPSHPGQSGGSGTANTGGGGGGIARCAPGTTNSGAGGSGIVIIRYKFQ